MWRLCLLPICTPHEFVIIGVTNKCANYITIHLFLQVSGTTCVSYLLNFVQSCAFGFYDVLLVCVSLTPKQIISNLMRARL